MKRLKKFLIRNPFVVVAAVALAVVSGMVLAGSRGDRGVRADIVFEDAEARDVGADGSGQRRRVHYDVTADPNFKTADRLRDASSVALLLGLRRILLHTQSQPAPPDVAALVDGIAGELASNGVMKTGTPGALTGPGSTIYVRYRVAPFSVEVVSVPSAAANGDTMIVRVPAEGVAADAPDERQAEVFTLPYSKQINLPAPFSSRALIEAQGWKSEKLRQSLIQPEQVKQMLAQLQRVR